MNRRRSITQTPTETPEPLVNHSQYSAQPQPTTVQHLQSPAILRAHSASHAPAPVRPQPTHTTLQTNTPSTPTLPSTPSLNTIRIAPSTIDRALTSSPTPTPAHPPSSSRRGPPPAPEHRQIQTLASEILQLQNSLQLILTNQHTSENQILLRQVDQDALRTTGNPNPAKTTPLWNARDSATRSKLQISARQWSHCVLSRQRSESTDPDLRDGHICNWIIDPAGILISSPALIAMLHYSECPLDIDPSYLNSQINFIRAIYKKVIRNPPYNLMSFRRGGYQRLSYAADIHSLSSIEAPSPKYVSHFLICFMILILC